MVTREVFWGIIQAYGARIWPVQVIFYLAAILIVGWIFIQPGRIPSLMVKLFLSVAFAWNGILFYLILARGMAGGSYGNYFFGALFILVSLLFAVDLFRQKMRFALPAASWRKVATLSLVALVFCYPFFGRLSGRSIVSLIFPGTFPCPTIALGLLLLTIALPQVDKIIYLLLLFCAIPFTPFFQIARYGVYEDATLFVVGVYSLVLLVKFWPSKKLRTWS